MREVSKPDDRGDGWFRSDVGWCGSASPRRRWGALAFGLVALSVGLGWSGRARAEQHARLVYVRGEGTDGCPAEVDLRLWVIARLGYDPFSPMASRVVLARIEAGPQELRGRVELVDAQGAPSPPRSLLSPVAQCRELARAMALSISLAIDPEYETGARVASPLPAAAATVAPEPAPKPTPVASASGSERRDPLKPWRFGRLQLGGAAAVGGGELPGVAWGGAAFVTWRVFPRMSAVLDLRALTSTGQELFDGGRLSGTMWGGGLSLCVELFADFSSCAVATLSSQRLSSSGVASPASSVGAFVGLGPRLLWRAPLGSHAGFWVSVEGLFNASRNVARYAGVDVWRAPPICGLALIGVDAFFL